MLKSKEYVYAVYQEKSFSKAAEKLYISQPALSAGIKKVEQKINAPIFNRSTTPISLTTEGEHYIECIEKIMEIEQHMTEYFLPVESEKQIHVTIGSSAFFCAHILPTVIESFCHSHPNYVIDLVESDVASLKAGLDDGSLSLTLEVEELDQNQYVSKAIKQEHLLLAVPKEFAINQELEPFRLTFQQVQSGVYQEVSCPSVYIEHFSQQPFIFLKKGNDSHQRCSKICQLGGFRPQITMHIDQLLTAYYIACSGKGLAFIRAGITGYVEPTDKLYFYKINDALATRNIYLSYKKSKTQNKSITEFYQYLGAKQSIDRFFVPSF